MSLSRAQKQELRQLVEDYQKALRYSRQLKTIKARIAKLVTSTGSTCMTLKLRSGPRITYAKQRRFQSITQKMVRQVLESQLGKDRAHAVMTAILAKRSLRSFDNVHIK
jgi:phosphopantothenate synthetase